MTGRGEERVTYLLGAGASVDAGLPVSVDLTKRITDEVSGSEYYDPPARVLHAAIGAMVAYDTAHGKNAYAGIDVERIFAAIRMLGVRNDHELAPFVAAWNSGLDAFSAPGSRPGHAAGQFADAVTKIDKNSKRRIAQAFTDGVRALSGPRDSSSIFKALEARMIESLVTTLAVDENNVGYLSPLFKSSDRPVQIATLNYDKSVEFAAQRAGLRIETGIENWSGSYGWTWSADADVQLLKLHGSLEWRLGNTSQSSGFGLGIDTISVAGAMGDSDRSGDALGVVFGQGTKLRADGPFLAMLVEFDRMLISTDHLVIVGYSLRDDHINSLIRRWVGTHPDGLLTIIDPNFPDPGLADTRAFQGRLVTAFYRVGENGSPEYPYVVSDRLRIIRKGAAEGLNELFAPELDGIERSA